MFGKDISGGYQQYICVPSRNIIEIPDDLSFAHASVLGCAFSTSLHALYKVFYHFIHSKIKQINNLI